MILQELFENTQQVTEFNIKSPKLKASAAASKARVGMEFEMIVRPPKIKYVEASPPTDSLENFLEFFKIPSVKFKKQFAKQINQSKLEFGRDLPFRDYLRRENLLNKNGQVTKTRWENSWMGGWLVWPTESGLKPYDDPLKLVVSDFSKTLGRPAEYGERYHSLKRKPGVYAVEPDGSIRAPGQNKGLEFVSPPLSIPEIIGDLKTIRKWAQSRGHYTNKSTGLHMNISVPGFNREDADYVKLVLLSEDQDILAKFQRQRNYYVISSFNTLKDILKSDFSSKAKDMGQFLLQMRRFLNKQGRHYLTMHEASVGFRGKKGNQWIEFRSPGGDWLNKNYDLLEGTLYNYAVAMQAALDPEAYREQYLFRLRKLLDLESLRNEVQQELIKAKKHNLTEVDTEQQDITPAQVDQNFQKLDQLIDEIF